MEVYGVVYTIIDGTNDFEYIGQTTKTVEKRFKEHMKSPYRIGKAIRAHGAENFVIAILKVCYSKAELDFWEKHFIKSRDTMVPNGYNCTEGGEGVSGWKHTEETKAQIAASLSGENHPSFGKPFSDEHCKKLALKKLGNKLWLGKHHTEEAIMKNSVAHRGNSPYKNLLAELDAHKISYNKLAKLLGLCHQSISHKMRGKQNFTTEQKEQIKNLLSVEMSIEELFKQFDD